MEIFRLKETTCKWSWTAPNFNDIFSYASREISTVKLKFEKVNMFTCEVHLRYLQWEAVSVSLHLCVVGCGGRAGGPPDPNPTVYVV